MRVRSIEGKMVRFFCGSCNLIISDGIFGSPRGFALLILVIEQLGGPTQLPFSVRVLSANHTRW